MNYLVGILIGAIIGYITNWLAIKMLFRPRTEKRIFGFKVPFTPGLIPKEKSRIAKNVGETVGTHLLTEDNLLGAMKSPKVKEHLNSIAMKKYNEIKCSTRTVEEIGKDLVGSKYTIIRESLKEKSSTYVMRKLCDEGTLQNITKEISLYIKELLKNNPSELMSKIPLEDILRKVLEDGNLENNLEEYINTAVSSLELGDKKLKDIIPQEVFQGVEVYTFNERDEIALYLRRLLRKEEVIAKIKKIIEKNFMGNINPLVSMFLNVDSIYAKFMNMADDYLLIEENKQELAGAIGNILREFGEKEVGELLNGVPDNSKDAIVKDIARKLGESFREEKTMRKVLENIYNFLGKFQTLEDILRSFNVDCDKVIELKTNELVHNIVNNEKLKEKIQVVIEETITFTEKKQIKDVIPSDGEEYIKLVFDKIQENIDGLIKSEWEEFIRVLNIANIVEKQINTFPVEYAEELIIDIADKELRAITWLGALLGGMMGLLTPLLSKLIG